jgi:hypothetical protein
MKMKTERIVILEVEAKGMAEIMVVKGIEVEIEISGEAEIEAQVEAGAEAETEAVKEQGNYIKP